MHAAGAAVGLGLLLLGGPTRAQESAADIQQMNRAREPRAATEARQINPSAAPLASTAATTTPPDRLVRGSEIAAGASPALDQLSREGPTAQAGRQLANEARNAGPTPSATQRAQGRVTAVVRPEGQDQCDPQSPRRLSVACDRVIEARAGEFSSPDYQPLSAEQSLMAAQRQPPEMTADAASVARRLASGAYDESSEEALAVASTTLTRPGEDDDKREPTAEATAIDAIVASITTLVTGAPPNP